MTILDLYCGAGGAAMGYYQACQDLGIPVRIIGIDKYPQPDYPFEFVRGDAIIAAYKYAKAADFIHGSPPCQLFSVSTSKHKKSGYQYPNLIPATRHMIQVSGKPGVIENVMQAPIMDDLILRGDMFGLKVIRRRKFELVNTFCLNYPPIGRVKGTVLDGDFISVFGKGGYRKSKQCVPGWRPKWHQGSIMADWRYAMDMPWVNTYSGLAEAIPPAYTRWIATQIFSQIFNYAQQNFQKTNPHPAGV